MDTDMYNEKKIFNMCAMYNMNGHILWKHDENIGSYIYENFNAMGEIEKKKLCCKIISPSDLDKILLQYEANNLHFSQKIKDTKELISTIDSLLKRYHHKIGGYAFEDNMWRLYSYSSGQKKYDLKENEHIFDNSLSMSDVEDAECHKFVTFLVELFNRLSDNHKIHFKYIEDKYENIYWVIIKISVLNIEN